MDLTREHSYPFTKTKSNIDNIKIKIKKYFYVCKCCICPKLRKLDCCTSCVFTVSNNIQGEA